MSDFTDKCVAAINQGNPHLKASLTREISKLVEGEFIRDSITAKEIALPGYPASLQLVPPRLLKRRGISSQQGRNILMHSIAHIEYNAINLALDAAYRFNDMPDDYYRDWIGVADDEARHFGLIQDYLKDNDCQYGDFPAHNGLWDMALQTQGDIVGRMALVPRVLEARGLDVTPGIIERLQKVDDQRAVDILKIIYDDEIQHVKIGTRWFAYLCQQQSLDRKQTFTEKIEQYMHGELRGPFNISARLQADFDSAEMQWIQSL